MQGIKKGTQLKKTSNAWADFFHLFKEQMKKFVALVTKEKGKTAINEWENNDSNKLRALYSIFFQNYLLTCLKQDIPSLLKVIDIWTSS